MWQPADAGYIQWIKSQICGLQDAHLDHEENFKRFGAVFVLLSRSLSDYVEMRFRHRSGVLVGGYPDGILEREIRKRASPPRWSENKIAAWERRALITTWVAEVYENLKKEENVAKAHRYWEKTG